MPLKEDNRRRAFFVMFPTFVPCKNSPIIPDLKLGPSKFYRTIFFRVRY